MFWAIQRAYEVSENQSTHALPPTDTGSPVPPGRLIKPISRTEKSPAALNHAQTMALRRVLSAFEAACGVAYQAFASSPSILPLRRLIPPLIPVGERAQLRLMHAARRVVTVMCLSACASEGLTGAPAGVDLGGRWKLNERTAPIRSGDPASINGTARGQSTSGGCSGGGRGGRQGCWAGRAGGMVSPVWAGRSRHAAGHVMRRRPTLAGQAARNQAGRRVSWPLPRTEARGRLSSQDAGRVIDITLTRAAATRSSARSRGLARPAAAALWVG